MPATLGYWNIRALAQPIRLLLAYAGETVEEKRYGFGPAPEFSREEWLKEKTQLGVAFPNLPYYKDGDFTIVQSRAIMQHLARKHNLYGSTPTEQTKADIVASQLFDTLMEFIRVCLATYAFKTDYKTQREQFVKGLPDKLKGYSDFLGNNKWVAGNNITYVDFNLYEILDWLNTFEPGCVDKFANLSAYLKNFEALPAIKKYMASPECIKKPILAPFADWGGQ